MATRSDPQSGPAPVLSADPSPLRVHLRVVRALLMREMSARYGRTTGGYFWAVAEPVGMIMITALAFAALARTPELGQSFMVFFATGYLSFNFYRITAQQLSTAVRNNYALLQYPNVTPYDALVARLALQTLTNLFVAVIIMGVAVWWTSEPVRPNFPLLAGAVAAATLMAAGAGFMNAVLFHVFPTYEQLFNIVNRPLFLVSGIFFTPESMPSQLRDLLALNPLVHVISAFRQGIYPVYHATLSSLEYPFAVGLVSLFFGMILLRRYDERLVER